MTATKQKPKRGLPKHMAAQVIEPIGPQSWLACERDPQQPELRLHRTVGRWLIDWTEPSDNDAKVRFSQAWEAWGRDAVNVLTDAKIESGMAGFVVEGHPSQVIDALCAARRILLLCAGVIHEPTEQAWDEIHEIPAELARDIVNDFARAVHDLPTDAIPTPKQRFTAMVAATRHRGRQHEPPKPETADYLTLTDRYFRKFEPTYEPLHLPPQAL